MRLGIQDLSVTAEHVRDWVRAEDAFEAAWQDLMTFQQAHPADSAIERFEEAERRWRSVSRTTVQEHVRNGFTAALVFDYRGFGESGGAPRQVVDLPSQHEDLRAVVAWVRGRDDLDADRVALWGTSLGGAHVISVAADDPRIVAVVAQIPSTASPGGSPHSLQT
jgi:pimeloyl-ACP methyl ester carboxylesterase